MKIMNCEYIKTSPEGKILLPNIKKIFVPDEGYTIFDADLSGADIQVVAADSECKWLLDYFSKPDSKKVYAHIASEFFQRDISDKSSEYKTYKGVFHGTNYMMGVKKLASMAGISEALAQGLQDYYFKLNPEIKAWHKRLEHDVKTKGYVRNKFGRRMEFWITRNNPTVMNEVCAAIPQSSISDLINRIWVKAVEVLPQIQVLLQVHDSIVFQYPSIEVEWLKPKLRDILKVPIPYDPPLYIGVDFKISSSSYGDCK